MTEIWLETIVMLPRESKMARRKQGVNGLRWFSDRCGSDASEEIPIGLCFMFQFDIFISADVQIFVSVLDARQLFILINTSSRAVHEMTRMPYIL